MTALQELDKLLGKELEWKSNGCVIPGYYADLGEFRVTLIPSQKCWYQQWDMQLQKVSYSGLTDRIKTYPRARTLEHGKARAERILYLRNKNR